MWKENRFSSLIMAAQDQDPQTLAKDVLPVLLSYPTPFAIYHQYLQVLPSRTHSHMQMSSFGG
ncbi:hypothetical protein YC2023_018203 [Brassica napus]